MKIKLSKRELWLLIVLGLVIALYVFFQTLYLPRLNNISLLRSKLSAAKHELTAAQEKIKLLQRLESGTLQKFRAKKTKEEQTIEALKYISNSISRYKLDLISIRPRADAVAVDAAKAMFFDIVFAGGYNDVYKFTRALERLPILILVDSLDMKKGEKTTIRVSMVLSVYY